MRMFYDDSSYVIAESAEAALFAWAEHTGEDEADYDVNEWRPVNDSRKLSIDIDDDGNFRTQTVAEWIAECGPGVLASSDY